MKVLIFGVGGMIGHRVWLETKSTKQFEMFGVLRKSVSQYESYGIFKENIFDNVDVLQWANAEEILNKVKPDVIINALGITIRKPEMASIEIPLEINSFFPRRLLKWVQENNSRLIHFSTDCVYDGAKGHYYETSQPSAKDIYGKTKFLGEVEGDNALTLRFSCIGQELHEHTELLDWFLAQEGKKIKGYSHAMYSGVTSTIVAKEVCRILTNFPKLNGLYQISSNPISKYDLLNLARAEFGINVEIEKFDDYVSDKTLVCDKYAKATGFRAPSWPEMMREIAKDKRITYKKF